MKYSNEYIYLQVYFASSVLTGMVRGMLLTGKTMGTDYER
jgi:hypothetical protein